MTVANNVHLKICASKQRAWECPTLFEFSRYEWIFRYWMFLAPSIDDSSRSPMACLVGRFQLVDGHRSRVVCEGGASRAQTDTRRLRNQNHQETDVQRRRGLQHFRIRIFGLWQYIPISMYPPKRVFSFRTSIGCKRRNPSLKSPRITRFLSGYIRASRYAYFKSHHKSSYTLCIDFPTEFLLADRVATVFRDRICARRRSDVPYATTTTIAWGSRAVRGFLRF